MESRCAIVGAGITGLVCARALVKRGHRVTVFDKGYSPGGRTASRARPGEPPFDHGAQYLTVRSPELSAEAERLRRLGVLAEWWPRLLTFSSDGLLPKPETERSPVRLVGVPSMRSLALHLADGLDLRSGVTVAPLRLEGEHLLLKDAASRDPVGVFRAVGVTVPAPQASPLVQDVSKALAARASAARFVPTWAVMLAFEQPLDTLWRPLDGGPRGFDAIFVNEGPLSWIARESSKPGRDGGERLVLHASRGVGVDATPEAALRLMQAHRFEVLGIRRPPSPTFVAAHRWRYAFPEAPLGEGCLVDRDHRVALAGDWTSAEARIEGAYLAGLELARGLEELLG